MTVPGEQDSDNAIVDEYDNDDIDEIVDIDVEEEEDENESAPSEYKIESYSVDFDVEGLVRRFKSGDIEVPFYQRGDIWNRARKSSFIESLLLGLPVPGIFLSQDRSTKIMSIIDGRQRLSTMLDYYNNKFPLKGGAIQDRFKGLKYDALSAEMRRNLDNAVIHAEIIREDEDLDEDSSGIIEIFKRLNEKPTPLSAQEIRSSVYNGELIKLLDDLNDNETWRKILNTQKPHPRLKDHEIILRSLAFKYDIDNYIRPMGVFLDKFAYKHRNLESLSKDSVKQAFVDAIHMSYTALGESAFRVENKNKSLIFKLTIFDAALTGISDAIENGKCDASNLKEKYDRLLTDKEFIYGTEAFTNDQDRIEARVGAALRVFND